jgi:hypothetical protein
MQSRVESQESRVEGREWGRTPPLLRSLIMGLRPRKLMKMTFWTCILDPAALCKSRGGADIDFDVGAT